MKVTYIKWKAVKEEYTKILLLGSKDIEVAELVTRYFKESRL